MRLNILSPIRKSEINSLSTQFFHTKHHKNVCYSMNDLSPRRVNDDNSNLDCLRTLTSEMHLNFPLIQENKERKDRKVNLKLYNSPKYLYQKIFKQKGLFRNRNEKMMNNIFNLDYAEDEKMYELKKIKENKKLAELGKPLKHNNHSKKNLDIKLKDCREKISFMKGVIDYSYPGFVVSKIKEVDKNLKEKYKEERKIKDHLCPVNERRKKESILREERKKYLLKSFSINSY